MTCFLKNHYTIWKFYWENQCGQYCHCLPYSMGYIHWTLWNVTNDNRNKTYWSIIADILYKKTGVIISFCYHFPGLIWYIWWLTFTKQINVFIHVQFYTGREWFCPVHYIMLGWGLNVIVLGLQQPLFWWGWSFQLQHWNLYAIITIILS